MKVIIAGTRDFNDYASLKRICDYLLSEIAIDAILCGECRGVDLMGKRYAEERGIPVESYPADWKRYGRAAGPKRNAQMASAADCLIAFWDGVSKGTANMIKLMGDKPVRIVRIDHEQASN